MSEEDSKEDRINNWDDQNVFRLLLPDSAHGPQWRVSDGACFRSDFGLIELKDSTIITVRGP